MPISHHPGWGGTVSITLSVLLEVVKCKSPGHIVIHSYKVALLSTFACKLRYFLASHWGVRTMHFPYNWDYQEVQYNGTSTSSSTTSARLSRRNRTSSLMAQQPMTGTRSRLMKSHSAMSRLGRNFAGQTILAWSSEAVLDPCGFRIFPDRLRRTKAPGPGPIQSKVWNNIAKDKIDDEGIIFHSDSARAHTKKYRRMPHTRVVHCCKRWKDGKWTKPFFSKHVKCNAGNARKSLDLVPRSSTESGAFLGRASGEAMGASRTWRLQLGGCSRSIGSKAKIYFAVWATPSRPITDWDRGMASRVGPWQVMFTLGLWGTHRKDMRPQECHTAYVNLVDPASSSGVCNDVYKKKKNLVDPASSFGESNAVS